MSITARFVYCGKHLEGEESFDNQAALDRVLDAKVRGDDDPTTRADELVYQGIWVDTNKPIVIGSVPPKPAEGFQKD